ncbi:MAG TPA: DegV family protein [Anaerolineaceae bacterium]|jgi:DegV family protein with EDD domain|nr:DegV family protein [Anaerolineaceae bacterium]
MVRITTDSTADLGIEISTQRSIDTIPLIVDIHDHAYKDGVTIEPRQLFQLVEQYNELPKTSAPSILEFTDFFKDSPEIVHITISSKISCSYQNACLAIENQAAKNIHVIDSLNLSSGIGLLVLKAADLRDAGCSAQEIASQISTLIPTVRTSFVVDTLDYLYKGGRCSALQNIMGSLLKIHPVIEMRSDGTLGVRSKVRGARKKALQKLLDDLEKNLPALDRDRIFITHSSSPEDAEYLKAEIQRIAAPREIFITQAGAVISSHCGPGTIGILYLVRPEA